MDRKNLDLIRLGAHGWVPNNNRLPVIHYRQALKPTVGQDMAGTFEHIFARNGWPPRWRDRVYDYHHYHSTAHEVLGFATGSGVLTIGGPEGRDIEVTAGDAILLPVGTGHRAISSSSDFLVVGAYPAGQDWDICCQAPDAETRLRMASLATPDRDPVDGDDGPVMEFWTVSQES